jgi:hypothetical protein
MSDDTRLILLIALIWIVIAIAYTSYLLPIIVMPIGFRVWGAGAIVFLLLGIAVIIAERRGSGG